MKISITKKVWTLALSFISVCSYAGKIPDPPPPGPPGPPPVPIDGSLFVLLILAFLYGSYKLFQKNSLQKK
jgi:hypothetical protein